MNARQINRSPRRLSQAATLLALAIVAASPVSADVPHDACATAEVISDGTPATEGSNADASPVDDAEASCQASSDYDVWFEYVATCTGQATVDTFGSGQHDTVLSVHDACGGTEIACNDDYGSLMSHVSFATSAGQSYWIRLASYGAPGDYDLNITCVGVPSNDTCSSAMPVGEGAPAASGNNAQASPVDDDEASCQDSDYDVWFSYGASCYGIVTIDTFGSGQQDTVLSVYEAGCPGGGAPEIACDDDTDGGHAQVSFVANAPGWLIRLGSYGPPGDYELNITCTPFAVNDDCADAQVITDGAPAATGDNSLSLNPDDAEATCQPGSDGDVWFEYQATCTGAATVDTFGSGGHDTVLSVYDGCGGAEIACNDDYESLMSKVCFPTVSGESYLIRLGSVGAGCPYVLNVACTEVPGNDSCSAPQVVGIGTPAATGTNAQAVLADDDEATCQPDADGDVWFEFTSEFGGPVVIDTFGSDQHDTVLSVYDACGGTELACNDDTGSLHAEVTVDTFVDQVLAIRVASFGAAGPYDLNIRYGGDCAGGAGSGDPNADGTVDLVDFAAFDACFFGPTGGVDPGCECFDLDADGDVTLADFAKFQAQFNQS